MRSTTSIPTNKTAGIADSLGFIGGGVRQLGRNLQRYVDAHNVDLARRSQTA